MTSLDHPRVIAKKGQCSRCHYELFWSVLEPVVLPNDRVQVLCPSCRMDRINSVCCDGVDDAQVR